MAQLKKKKKDTGKNDPSKYIEVNPMLDEAAKGTAVIAWGRMNPMTAGHEKLVKKVMDVAKSEKGTPHVFLTHSYDSKKNPLSYNDKIKYTQKAFGPVVKKSTATTIFELLKQLNVSFNKIVLVAGSDRVKEFNTTLNKYNGKEYNFDEIKVVSAGSRDPDADDVSGISGTKMRNYAATDMAKFKKNLPKRIQGDAENIASSIRKGMNMSESEEIHVEEDIEVLDEILDRQARRKLALQMRKYKHKMARGREKAKKRTATLDVLKKRSRKAAINVFKKKFAKSRRYADLSTAEKIVIDKRIAKISKSRIEAIAKKLMPKVKQMERERKLNMAKGGATKKESVDLNSRFETFMEDYYKGVPKDKKDDREAHFKRKAEKPGDGPDKDSNYTDAPGDIGKDGERVKTKLSKHTKKYRDMFGEGTLWGQKITKRPHMLLDKNGKTKFDGRFKMFKPKVNEEFEDLTEDLFDLIESAEQFELELNEDPSKSLKKKSEKSGMSAGILRQVYNRGVAAWKSGHRPGTTPEQWGHARVNSFITKSSGTWGKADSDLAAKVRKEEVEEGSKTPLGRAFDNQKKDIKKDLDALKDRLSKKEESELDEVLDTPKAMDSYKDKAKYSRDRAAGSAAAKILRGKDKDGNRADHSPELKTMAKRNKGLASADRNAKKKTFKALRGEEVHEKYRPSTPEEIKKDKERERKASGKQRPSMSDKSVTKKTYGSMMGGLKSKHEEHGAGEEGTDKLVNKYKKDTPNA